jgi:hypothetical protein
MEQPVAIAPTAVAAERAVVSSKKRVRSTFISTLLDRAVKRRFVTMVGGTGAEGSISGELGCISVA